MGYNNNNMGLHITKLGDNSVFNDYAYGSDRSEEVRFMENVLKNNPDLIKNAALSYRTRMLSQKMCA